MRRYIFCSMGFLMHFEIWAANPPWIKEHSSFSASTLTTMMESPDFKGAMMICNPMCEVLAVRLEDKWEPDLSTIQISSRNVKFLSKTDPLFGALFPKAPPVESKEETPPAPPAPIEAKSVLEKDEKNIDPIPQPIPPKVNFNNGFRVSPALRLTHVSHKSDRTPQSLFKPDEPLGSVSIAAAYMRAKPLRLLGAWWQFELSYGKDIYSTKTKFSNGSTFFEEKTETQFVVWNISHSRSSAFGPKLRILKDMYKVSNNTLSSFSYEEDTKFLGLAYRKGRYRFDFDYGIQHKISEDQPFRGELEKFQIFSLEGNYCRNSTRIYSYRVTNCFSLGILQSSNTAKFNPVINSIDSVSFDRTNIYANAIWHFGEDFLR